ncbi:hypothetical protein BS47DRAFT_224530 [Hydnum rufescens UP504]|uniref:C2H2-type domain-containing protein n=1 Tax=Hydnum rufescens UP504 TaxID=1448309 RepID=A0A9P6B6P8_9AGAM|nr:hypothetical protein BS47DRAFT_224530 [Hydnum rufescens UP504]
MFFAKDATGEQINLLNNSSSHRVSSSQNNDGKHQTGNRVPETDAPPYICSTCSSRFPRKADLTRHIHSTHEGETYWCSCGTPFSREDNRKRHMKQKNAKGEKHSPVP